VRQLQLKIHVLLDEMHRHMAGTFDHDLNVMLPRNLREFAECRELAKLSIIVRIGDGTGTQSVAQAEGNVVCLHDFADLFEMRIQEILLMMGQAPLCEDRSASADDSRPPAHGQRNVSKQNAGMDREVIDSLLRLLDQRIPIHFPRESLGPATRFLERLVNGNRSDRHGRVSKNPFARFVNVAACGKIHHGVRAPRDAPAHFLDFVFNGAGDRAVADVRIDLHQEVPSDDHRLGFRMVDVRRNDRASARDFIANEFRRDVFRNACSEGFPGMLEPDV